MYFVYVLLCKDETLYTGIARDVLKRFEEHRQGIGAKYTRAHGARRILYTERHDSRSSAQKREAEIKKMARTEKLALIAKKTYQKSTAVDF